ncbi:hypothetical protein C7S20_16980 [Christiangramia fulva]|uniref:Carboxymuconolactone decarboxylase-like domain-containing protein n=1 Tax=Christiangramia fulva TaxID=2126553 RepID=A0A2R3Z963_9FLAO|nr:carboxymuconolactone decarboxylase family protein [Christiangramia fulva]AVR46818.1 hypothetical protein C7S20_16980 [Christiangramia fulva]
METKNYSKLVLCAIKGIQEMEECAIHNGVEQQLLELVKLRAFQINSCTSCESLQMDDSRERGEDMSRLEILSDWKESDHFSEREKAALTWTEALMYSPVKVDIDQILEEIGAHFTEQELISITVTVNAVNNWNNLSLVIKAAYGN